MRTVETETAIVGSGLAGTIVARELVAANRDCVIVERGSFLGWEEQIAREDWEGSAPSVAHNHENDPAGLDWPWTYVYGVGGTTNRWAGTSPRFLPEDFEMRSRYGVMRDWPLSYEELLPFYRVAEEAMAVSGERNELMPGGGFPVPAHPLSPQDRIVSRHLAPFIPLVQSRPSEAVGDVAACCGSARCQLCPVNARFSVLNRLGGVLEAPGVRLLDETIATKLTGSPRRVEALECITAKGERLSIRAKRFVVAANGIESVGLLLRSGIEGGDTGRYLFDHRNAKLLVGTREAVRPGRGASLLTGASYAYYGGTHRRGRAAALVLPLNLGPPPEAMYDGVVQGVLANRAGRRVRREAVRRWERTLALDVYLDDLPDRANTVRLSSKRDRFGLPLNLVRFGPETAYQRRAVEHLVADVPRRLAPLGAGEAKFLYVPQGGHLLGTLRMGTDAGAVVDSDLLHRWRDNLFVSGGSVFPTFSPTHPTLTIGALGARLGRRLAEQPAD